MRRYGPKQLWPQLGQRLHNQRRHHQCIRAVRPKCLFPRPPDQALRRQGAAKACMLSQMGLPAGSCLAAARVQLHPGAYISLAGTTHHRACYTLAVQPFHPRWCSHPTCTPPPSQWPPFLAPACGTSAAHPLGTCRRGECAPQAGAHAACSRCSSVRRDPTSKATRTGSGSATSRTLSTQR